MAVRQIIVAGNPILRQKAQKVKAIDASIQKLIDDMVETMRAADGIGLAAPQVAVRLRVIVVELPQREDDPQSGKLYALVNPEITKVSEETWTAEEGCLSIPYYYGEVVRPHAVVVKAKDRRGKDIKIKAEGMLARVLQHEIDHLDGILFIDRMESLDKLRYVPPRAAEEAQPEVVGAGSDNRSFPKDVGILS